MVPTVLEDLSRRHPLHLCPIVPASPNSFRTLSSITWSADVSTTFLDEFAEVRVVHRTPTAETIHHLAFDPLRAVIPTNFWTLSMWVSSEFQCPWCHWTFGVQHSRRHSIQIIILHTLTNFLTLTIFSSGLSWHPQTNTVMCVYVCVFACICFHVYNHLNTIYIVVFIGKVFGAGLKLGRPKKNYVSMNLINFVLIRNNDSTEWLVGKIHHVD